MFGIVPIAITVIGIIFSILWIMMAKGSKAWQEIYEDSIAKVSVIKEFWCNKSFNEVYGETKDNEFLFGNLSLKDGTKCDKCLFSTAGGAFSVSKINVMIGIVFLIIFVLLFFGHVLWTLLCIEIYPIFQTYEQIFLFLIFCLTLVLIYWYVKDMVSSSYDFKNNQMSA